MMKLKASVLLFFLFTCLTFRAECQQEPYLRGIAATNQKDYKAAIENFTSGISVVEIRTSCIVGRGKAYYNLGKYDDAIRDFLEAEKAKPGIASYDLSRCYARQGNIENTIYYMRIHLESPYKVPESEIKKEDAFSVMEKFKDWKNLWQTEWYSKPEKISAEANYLVNSGDNLEAVELVNNSLLHYPQSHELYVARARAFVALGNQRSALDDYNTAISHNKRNAIYYKERGSLLFEAGRDHKSIEDFTKALKLKPEMFELYLLRAQACKRAEDYIQAIKDIELYLKFFPENEEAAFTASQIYYEDGKYDESMKKLTPLIAKNPSKPEYYHARGLVYFEMRELDAAINDYSQALDLNPDLSESWYNKGLARYYKGDREGACSDWKKARDLGNQAAGEHVGMYCK